MDTAAAYINVRFRISEPDSNNSRFTDPVILRELNQSTKNIAAIIEYPTRVTPLTSVAKQREYDLADRTLVILEATYDGMPLNPSNWGESQRRNAGVTIYGTPDSYYLVAKVKIGMILAPADAGDTINVFNIYEPASIVDGGDLPYNEESVCDLVCLDCAIRLLTPNFKEEARYLKESEWANALTKAMLYAVNREGQNYVRNLDED